MKTALFALLLLVVVAGCTKEKITNIVPPATLEGEWYGRYGYISNTPTNDWYFKIRADHTMRISTYDTTTTSFGDSTYFIVPGDSLRCTYTIKYPDGTKGTTFSIICKPNSNFSYLTGTWGNGNNAYNGGAFFMGRKQQ